MLQEKKHSVLSPKNLCSSQKYVSVKTQRIIEVPEERKIISSLLKLTINVFTQKVHKNNERGVNTDVSLCINSGGYVCIHTTCTYVRRHLERWSPEH